RCQSARPRRHQGSPRQTKPRARQQGRCRGRTRGARREQWQTRSGRVTDDGARQQAGLSIFAEHPLSALMTLLRLERQGGDWSRIEPLQADGLAGLLAIAVSALLDAGERSVDLGDQLALAVARPEL